MNDPECPCCGSFDYYQYNTIEGIPKYRCQDCDGDWYENDWKCIELVSEVDESL